MEKNCNFKGKIQHGEKKKCYFQWNIQHGKKISNLKENMHTLHKND